MYKEMDIHDLEKELALVREAAKSSVAPSVATRSVAGAKRRAGADELEEEEVEQAKKRRVKEKQKREADEEIDRRNAEEKKKEPKSAPGTTVRPTGGNKRSKKIKMTEKEEKAFLEKV